MPFDLRCVAVAAQILTWEFFWWSELIPHPKISLVTNGFNLIMLFGQRPQRADVQ